jgi:hypothetical protein
MTTSHDPPPIPNRPPPEALSRLIDLVAWAKTCLYITAMTAPSSPERVRELEKLREAVMEPRRLTDEILGSSQALPQVILVDLRVCELAIPKLAAGAVLRSSPPHGDAKHKPAPKSAP